MWFAYVAVVLILAIATGIYQLGTTTVIVTAGIGYSIVPIRYAAPGSIELVDLRVCGQPRG